MLEYFELFKSLLFHCILGIILKMKPYFILITNTHNIIILLWTSLPYLSC